MVYFHIETILLTIQRWTMVDHDLFSYRENLYHNAMLYHG